MKIKTHLDHPPHTTSVCSTCWQEVERAVDRQDETETLKALARLLIHDRGWEPRTGDE